MSDDLESLHRDLGEIPRHSGRFVKAALSKTAMDAKEVWRDLATGPSGGHASGYPHKIDFDVQGDWPSYQAEVGPNLGGQGSLGILEDSPGGVASAPQKARPKVAKAIESDFEKGLDKAVDDALRRAGL